MTASSQPTAPTPSAAASEIDFSCRLPLLVLFISAGVWLVIAWAFELIASIKFHSPNFLADSAWLTYGRVHPVYTNSLIYGCAVQAGLGVVLWLLARLGATPLANRGLVTVGAIIWNLGVTLGVLGILAGGSTGFEHLEMPGYATFLVFLGYAFIALWGVATFHQRRQRRLAVSHWFLLTALFWFPWIYSTSSLLLQAFPVRGVAQAVIDWWFTQNLLVVWFSLVGLGALFQLLPELTARPLHSHYLAFFAYWLLILFAGWGGIPDSAPVPVWMPALSTVGTVLFLVSVLAVALNSCETMGCSLRAARGNPITPFLLVGVVAFILAALFRAGLALLDGSQTLHLTWFGPAVDRLNVYAFFIMLMFGAVYYIMPHLLGVEFPWPKLIRAHFWIAAVGILLLVVPLLVSGVVEEAKLQNASEPFVLAMRSTLPFLRVSTIGDLLLLIGHVFFVANLVGATISFYRGRAAATYAQLTADLFKTAGAKP